METVLILAGSELCIPFLCLLVLLKSQRESEETHLVNKMIVVIFTSHVVRLLEVCIDKKRNACVNNGCKRTCKKGKSLAVRSVSISLMVEERVLISLLMFSSFSHITWLLISSSCLSTFSLVFSSSQRNRCSFSNSSLISFSLWWAWVCNVEGAGYF